MIFNEDYLDVAIFVIIVILIFVLLCWAYCYGTEKCEKNGGVVINGRGYTCLTKEDMAKLRGKNDRIHCRYYSYIILNVVYMVLYKYNKEVGVV